MILWGLVSRGNSYRCGTILLLEVETEGYCKQECCNDFWKGFCRRQLEVGETGSVEGVNLYILGD